MSEILHKDRSEEARLSALQQYDLLDTPPSESFDRITRMASQIFNLPISAVSLTDRDRQWFKSRIGVEHSSIPREQAPCGQVAETTDVLVIPDFKKDACYADSVLGRSGIRFYAGAPLVTREGYGLGALCVLGTEPRAATEAEVAALKDLAAMVMAQIELQHAFGRIDPLSGLPSRNQFLDDLSDLAAERPDEARLAVLIDLARPEQINAYARVMGLGRIDDLIRDTARGIHRDIGRELKLYHTAATQFAFLAPPGVRQDDYVRRLTDGQREAQQRSITGMLMTSAIGVTVFAPGSTRPQDVLRALYGAVQEARMSPDLVGIYSLAADQAYHRRYRLLQDFGSALLAGDQLRLVFQPRIDLPTGRCIGAEALLRWNHPVLGPVSPSEFVPVIEHSPHAQAMTTFVLETALAQARRWRDAKREIVISVNVSAANLHEMDFAHSVQVALERLGLEPERLELEVTESAIMQDAINARRQLDELAAAGVRLAIDDFGTGYSSLAYLQDLPAHVVKIDRSFVLKLSEGQKEMSLVRSMIGLSHDLGYRVVAEGIETVEAADLLLAMQCDEAQGYFFARPLEVDEFQSCFEDHE
ncbi:MULTISPECIES: EAL domain-containing protein [unclassified Methylobacterium]|uniref:sensor domain-containing phosphodiesterase n=1 Tax=unclassified Methylobacterium TaxID=2615210 RepID=UPI0011C1E80E|nr:MULTISPECIES: EAL domain-containing protein [unclassified Methylobacterium]QEE39144.1 EAL domain-containing protein [Methylobacterium sp. WL1]TXN55596.1 EAL domain-containing protein [Methylobacterium sp. WL2]